MIITKIKYKFEDLEDEEDFINNIFAGLKKYEKTHHDFKFKVSYDKDEVEVKTISLNESVN